MNDVLPKPFTKEGLLSMLEKHLSHLKKQPPGFSAMAAPPPPDALVSAKRSMKSEDSPVTSPATVSNWNSPGGLTGASPVASNHPDDPYMHAMHNAAGPSPYAVQAPMGSAPTFTPVQPPQMGAPPRHPLPPGPVGPTPQMRRAISDISGGVVEMSDAKRQHMYAPAPPMQPMPQQMPQPMPPQMQRPSGR